MENLDPKLIEAMKLDAQSWKRGDKEALITTKSGSVYHVNSDGTLTGGHLGPARLSGAVYRGGGPIRVGYITVGLRVEAIINDEGVDKRVMVTSPVQSIEAP